jgi:hypothetical protein
MALLTEVGIASRSQDTELRGILALTLSEKTFAFIDLFYILHAFIHINFVDKLFTVL